MIGSTIKNGAVNNNNNQIHDSGNTMNSNNSTFVSGIQNVTFNIGNSGANQGQRCIREDFEEFRVSVKLLFQRNRNFCGRNDILGELHQILYRPKTPGNDPSRETVVLYGMGGIGKSQIALEYAQRFGRYYTSIFWIDAENASRTTNSACKVVEQLVTHYARKWRSAPDYQEIANTLGIPGKIDSLGRITQGAMDSAMEGGPCLASGGQKPRVAPPSR
ncbi:hypothetical protein RUND412_004177 [Rhizina undulata]